MAHRAYRGAVMVVTVVDSAADLASGPQVMTRSMSLTGADRTLVAGHRRRITGRGPARDGPGRQQDPLISLIGPTT